MIKTGVIKNHPVFKVLTANPTLLKSQTLQQQIALRSGELHAVNDALNAGSAPQDLATLPLTLFVYED